MTAQPLSPGTRVGRYEVVAHIANGGMSEVYRARDAELDRDVALKILPGHLADNPACVERFRREARLAARLTHKHIVTLHDWGQDAGTWFLAMEYVDGVDLHSYIAARGRLDPQEACVILVQAVKALDHAFAQGITHRDIKPSNFLLSRQGQKIRVKLTDLGLARTAGDEEFRVTRDGTTVGTVDYLAPEQARDSNAADIRSDIYSLGCTLYHMLAGQAPFAGGGLGERVYKHQQIEPVNVRQFNRRVPRALWAVLQRMLAKRPEDRYQTPAELLAALRALNAAVPGRAADSEVGMLAVVPRRPPPPTSVPHSSQPEILQVGAEQRATASAQYQEARALLHPPEPDARRAYELLVSCCKLDPTDPRYRRKLRQVGLGVRRRQRLSCWHSPPPAVGAAERLAAALRVGDDRKALEYGEEVLAKSPADMATHLAMSDAAARLNLAPLHVWLLEQARKQDLTHPEPLRRLARVREQRKELGKAIALWQSVRAFEPLDAEAARKLGTLLRALARAYEQQDETPNALAVWRALLKVRPQDAEAMQRVEELTGTEALLARRASEGINPLAGASG